MKTFQVIAKEARFFVTCGGIKREGEMCYFLMGEEVKAIINFNNIIAIVEVKDDEINKY